MSVKSFIIIPVGSLSQVDFEQVLDTSAESVRKSVDGQSALLKWIGEMPSTVSAIQTKSQVYDETQILTELANSTWTPEVSEQ